MFTVSLGNLINIVKRLKYLFFIETFRLRNCNNASFHSKEKSFYSSYSFFSLTLKTIVRHINTL